MEKLLEPILESHPKGSDRIRSHLLSSLVGLGRSTVTGMLCTSGMSHRDWSADYRLYSKERIEGAELFESLRQSIQKQHPAQTPVVVAIDDTLFGKTGRKVSGARYRRDPQGPPFGCNLKWSQRFLQCSVAVGSDPCAMRMVPVDLVHAPGAPKPGKRSTDQERIRYEQEKNKLKVTQVGANRLRHLCSQWDPQQQLIITVDGGYTNQTFLRQVPPRATLIGRVRKDSQFHFAPQEQSVRGRKRRYGMQAPTPEQLRQDALTPYHRVEAFACGTLHAFKVKTLTGIRTRMDGATREYRLVVIAPLGYRPRKGSRLLYRKPAYLICSDPSMDLQTLIQSYVWRWEIEVNFRDQKTLLGIGQGQVRNPQSVESLPQLQTAAYSLLLLASENIPQSSMGVPLPKWRKSVPPRRITTPMLINQLRYDLWGSQINPKHFSGFESTSSPNTNAKKYTFDLPSALFLAAG